jgi:hypothetical protein
MWKLCCTKAPREEVVYCSQLAAALLVIIVGLLNITFTDNNTCLWSTLTSGAIGYLLPSPRINNNNNDALVPDPAV